MIYRVRVVSKAQLELYNSAIWWADHRDLEQAICWLDGFEDAIKTLSREPERHALALENDAFDQTLRQLLYELSKKPAHRAVFEVHADEVVVHAIRHLAQRELLPEDL